MNRPEVHLHGPSRSSSAGKALFGIIAALLVGLFLFNLPAVAQERFGQLEGTVKDSTGAVLPDATVLILHKTTNRTFTTKTGPDGTYVARDLEPGHYAVRFELSGFTTFEVPDVNLLVGKTLRVDSMLQVSASQQSIQVTEAAPLIDVTNTTIAHNVTSEEFNRLPKARTFQALAMTSPSVNSGEIEGGFQVNGASAGENLFAIDGVSTNSLIHGTSRQDAVFEILQEVQVKTGGIDAEYGGAMGGVISAITKSGGNAFHGDLHFYYSGNAISAGPVKRLLLDQNDDKTVAYVQDHKNRSNNYEPGYSLGGYFIKDKLWFFSAASPRWSRASNDYLFAGNETGSLSRKLLAMQAFEKISYDPTQKIRTNFTFLYSPTRMRGAMPGFNGYGNQNSSSLDSYSSYPNQGYTSPKTSYTGQVDYTLSSTSLLSVRGGRFWDNYRTFGEPNVSSVTYMTPTDALSPALLADVPQNERGGKFFVNVPRVETTFHDLATRTYIQADYSQFFRAKGTHDLKIGIGTQKMVNNVDISYPGGGYVYVYWGGTFTSPVTGRTDSGKYGYYTVNDYGTRGSVGAHLTNMYIQDQWRVIPRLTLSLGLRTEKETVPSFRRSYMNYAFQFPFQDKMAPRLGATLDVFGTGKLKVYGSWGRYFDWVKYDLARGTFGGDVWTMRYRSLDTPDAFSLSGTNYPGRNLWNNDPDGVRDRRVPSFSNKIDPNIKPMSTDLINLGVEYEIAPQTVFSGRYVHNNLRRTIEDMGVLVNGDEVYAYVNPGEGLGATMQSSTATPGPFATPKPKRTYDAMELTLSRRFSRGWFGNFSYVLSRLYGNYPGLVSSDEIITPTSGSSGSVAAQQWGGSIARAGTSASRAWDLDEYMFDSHGNIGIMGRLATDRPHVFKFYGSKTLEWGASKRQSTEIGGFFYGGSGTPLSTKVNTINSVETFVEGRGSMGRSPFLTQTDLVIAHEVKLSETKRLRFEFNALNVFNQKTSRHKFEDLNRGYVYEREGSMIDLSGVNLFKGYDYRAMINATPDASTPAGAYDPRYGMDDLFNPGFSGRLGVKFTF